MNNRRHFIKGLLLAATVLLPAFSYAEDVPAEVRFAYAGGPRTWILGKIDKSFDKAFGTPVKWIPFGSGSDVLTLFAAKEIDIARFGSSPAAAGIARKLPIEVIGTPEIIATSERLIARNGLTTFKGLEGKTVAYPPNSTAQYAFEVGTKLAKADRSKINVLTLKPAEIVAAWKRGDIDAAYVWGPFTQQLEADGGKEIFATRELQKHGVLIFNNFVVRKEFAAKYPELVTKFLRVAQDKVDQYKKDREGSAQQIAQHLNIPLETVRSTLSGLQYPSDACLYRHRQRQERLAHRDLVQGHRQLPGRDRRDPQARSAGILRPGDQYHLPAASCSHQVRQAWLVNLNGYSRPRQVGQRQGWLPGDK